MKPIPILQGGAPTLPRIFPTTNKLVFLLLALFLLALIPSASAQTRKKLIGGPSQWQSVGGIKIFSNDHVFKNTWVKGEKRGKMDMYWKNSESRKRPASHPADPEVIGDVLVK